MSDPLRAPTWDSYIGQRKLKSRIDVYCKAAAIEKRPLPHILLAGDSGFGKSTLAALIAQRVQDPFFSLTMSPQMRPHTLNAFFHRFEAGVVLFDEFHRLNKAQQEQLLDPLLNGYFTTPNGRRVALPWFTAIIATNEPEDIIPTVRRRIPVNNLSFEDYTDEELAAIVAGMADRLGFALDYEISRGLGRAAGGRPGEAVPLVYAAQSLSRLGPITLSSVLEFCEVDADGLTKAHRQVLAGVDRLGGTGTVGMDRLADYLGMGVSTIRGLERLLVDRDLVCYGNGGWELTTGGLDRIRTRQPTPAGPQYRERRTA